MELSLEALKEKEVIVACSGRKLGFPKDVIICCDSGRVEALVLCSKGFALFHREDTRIPRCDVERIGEDVIWVCREPVCR